MDELIITADDVSEQVLDHDGMFLDPKFWKDEVKRIVGEIEEALGKAERGVNVTEQIRTHLGNLEEILDKIPHDQITDAASYIKENLDGKSKVEALMNKYLFKSAAYVEEEVKPTTLDMKKPLKDLNKIIKKKDKDAVEIMKKEPGRTNEPARQNVQYEAGSKGKIVKAMDTKFTGQDKVIANTGTHKGETGIVKESRKGYQQPNNYRVQFDKDGSRDFVWYEEQELTSASDPQAVTATVKSDIEAGFDSIISELEKSLNPYIVSDLGKKLYKIQSQSEIVREGKVQRV
jgi:hypothetical protein